MYDEILSSIDNIDDCVMEAELNVLNAMINEYDKAIMIMENYNGNDYSSFDIFQESVIMEDGEKKPQPIFGNKGENIIKRILMFIPRLISTIIRNIDKLFNKKKDQEIIDRLQNPESQPKTQEQIKPGSGLSPEQTAELENLKKQRTEIVKKLNDLEAAGKDETDEYNNLYNQQNDLFKKIFNFGRPEEYTKPSELIEDLKKKHDRVKMWNDRDNDEINTCLKFDKTIGYLVDYRKALYESNKININDINSVENFVSEYSQLPHFLNNEKRVRKTILGSIYSYSKREAIEFITKKNSMIDDISESLNKEIKKYNQLLSNNNGNENDKNTYVYQKLLNFYQSINISITYIGKLINFETSKWGIDTPSENKE